MLEVYSKHKLQLFPAFGRGLQASLILQEASVTPRVRHHNWLSSLKGLPISLGNADLES